MMMMMMMMMIKGLYQDLQLVSPMGTMMRMLLVVMLIRSMSILLN
jgi:hypothetical protein